MERVCRCCNCKYWDRDEEDPLWLDDWGICRRRAPTCHPPVNYGSWPMIRGNEWCGEFKKCPASPAEVDANSP